MPDTHITVVIINHHHPSCLEQTICSVLDQGVDNLQLLLIDLDGAEQSKSIIHHYRHELTTLAAPPNRTPAAAFNHALPHVTGQYINILPSGALLLPGALHNLTRTLDGNQSPPTWLAGHCLHLSNNDRNLGQQLAQAPRNLATYLMHHDGLFPMPATFYHRSLFQQHGPLREQLQHAFDFDLNARLLAAGCKPTLIPAALASQRDPQHHDIHTILDAGREYVAVARRLHHRLPLSQRYAVWKSCDDRQRIYALAEAETHHNAAKRILWQKLLKQPWWLASRSYRQMLLQGHRTPAADTSRHAA